MADLKLKILMEAVDRVTAPIRRIRQGAAGLKAAVGAAADKLRALEATSRQMDQFRELKTRAAGNGQALRAAQDRATALARAMKSAETVTGAMKREFGQATAAVRKLQAAQERDAAELQRLRGELRGAGVDTAKFGAEQRRLKAEIAAATAAAEKQAHALERVTAKAKAMAAARGRMEKTQAMAGSMAGAGAAGLATGGGALFGAARIASVGVDFEAMMSKVGALAKVDKSSEAFAALEKQAFDLGATTSFSASQAAEAMANLAMAGFDANRILGVMPSMLNLAKAGSTELGSTASITANIMAGFGLQASQMGDVGDVLVATFTNSNTNLEMLGETMKYVAPIAKAAGYSLGDMATLSGLLGNVGIQGSEAGTAMRAAMLRLADPPKEAQKSLASLGVATKDVAGNMRPMASVLGDLAEKTKKMGNAQKLETFSKIFGMEASAAMTELVGQAGSKGIRDFANVIKQAHGLNDRISAQMADNAKGDLDNLSSAVEGVAIILTKLNITPLRDLTQWAAQVVTSFGEWAQANPGLAATLTRIAVVMAAVIAAGGALALTVAGILGPFAMARFAMTALGLSLQPLALGFLSVARAAVTAVVPALSSLAAAALANPVVWVVAGIAAAAAALIIGWEPIAGFFAGVWGRVSGIFDGAWARIVDALGFDPLAVVAGLWQPMADFFATLFATLPAPVLAAWDAVKQVLAWTPLGLIIANWQPIADFFAQLWDGILGKLSAVWAAIEDKVSGIRGVAEWAGGLWDGWFGGDGKGKPAPAPANANAPGAPKAVNIVPVPPAGGAAAAAQTPAPQPAPASAPAVHQTFSITVHAAPGMTAEDVAAAVKREFEKLAARERSAARSALYDR